MDFQLFFITFNTSNLLWPDEHLGNRWSIQMSQMRFRLFCYVLGLYIITHRAIKILLRNPISHQDIPDHK